MSQSHSLLLKTAELAQLGPSDSLTESLLTPAVLKHLKVLRINVGEHVCFMDGAGHFLETRCEKNQPWEFSVTESIAKPRSSPQIELALSLVKKEAFSLALTQATELGFDRLQMLETAHSTIAKKLRDSYTSRAQRLIEAATEQCRSPYLAEVQSNIPKIEDWLKSSKNPVVWADEALSRQNLMGFQQNDSLSTLKDAKACTLLIGPEGGWSDEERSLLQSNSNVFSLGLGSQILRVPTACTTAIALLKSFLHRSSALEEARVF